MLESFTIIGVRRLTTLQVGGLETAWMHANQSGAFLPDEGTLIQILDVAARHGRPSLAAEAVAMLPTISVTVETRHLVPLMEAHANAGKLSDAVKVILAYPPAASSTIASTAALISRLSSPEVIDQTFYALEDMQKNGQSVSILAINALISAAIELGDLQRSRAIQSAMRDLQVSPNVETYNLLLRGCVAAEHRSLGDTVLSEITQEGLSPDATTYSHMIDLCLITTDYEDAFFYLEQMKAQGVKPSLDTYRGILEKCTRNNDVRWRVVLEEMESVGYPTDNTTRRIINHAS